MNYRPNKKSKTFRAAFALILIVGNAALIFPGEVFAQIAQTTGGVVVYADGTATRTVTVLGPVTLDEPKPEPEPKPAP